MNATSYLETQLLNHVFRNSPYVQPETVYVGFVSTTPDDSGGIELIGNGYERKAVTFSAPSSGQIDSIIDLDWTANGNWLQIMGICIYDAETDGNMLTYSAINGPIVGTGSTINLNAGELTVSLD